MSTTATARKKAKAAWGTNMPDWIKALAEACDESGLRQTAAKLNASPAMLSLAINNRRENLEFLKPKVTSILMISMVPCPVLGVIGREECLREQAADFSAVNPMKVRLYRACRNGCRYYKEKKDEHRKKS